MKHLLIVLITVIYSISINSINAQKIANQSPTVKRPALIYGPISKGKIKDLFFTKDGFKLPKKISEINTIARYTSFESINGAGNIYTWDFTNGFQISSISEPEGKAGNEDKILLVSFNYGGINAFELFDGITLHKSTLAEIQKNYSNRLIKFKTSELPTYKLKTNSVYATFYFNKDNVLTSLSLSNYDLEI